MPDETPKPQVSQEPTVDNSANLEDKEQQQWLEKYGQKLIQLGEKTREQWAPKRRPIILDVMKNKEMLKGNQNLGIYPGAFDNFGADASGGDWGNWLGGGADQKNGDRTLDKRPHNFYQIMEKAFVAALSAALPKTRSLPMNAEVEEDRETAVVASRVQEIIERANDATSMLMQKLMELFTSGCYFEYARYVVDAARTGTHKETTLSMSAAEVLPARYVCFNCGVSTPADQLDF